MGEGFVVMQSNDVDIYYYQDEPGKLMHAHIRWDFCAKTLTWITDSYWH